MNDKLKKIHEELHTPHTDDGRVYFHPILMMHAAHIFGKTYTEFMTDYKVLVESNMKCLELYDHDAVSVISDSYREAAAFGAKITFNGNYSPKPEKIIFNMDDVRQLKNPDVYKSERTLDRIKGVEYFRKLLGNDFPVIGWIEGPLAEAADIMGVSEAMMNMVMEPDMIKMLLDKCLVTAKDFALAQINAGCNIIGVGDAVCSQIAQEMYDEFCLPLHQDLFEFIRSKGALVKVHICGNITHILPSLAKAGIDILDADWMVNMTDAHREMGEEVMICGNLDPVAVIMNGDEQLIRDEYLKAKNSIPAENWIMMGGCEIPLDTPIENMKYLRKISL